VITVNFIRTNNEKVQVKVPPGFTVMEAAKEADLDEIPASCGGCCACATCHCYVHDDWFSRLSPANDDEESMLDQAFDIKKNSRLSCQIPFTEELDGIVLTLAPKF